MSRLLSFALVGRWGLYAALLLVIFAVYVLRGGVIYDDWSVLFLGVRSDTLLEAYHIYFPSFANRPFAPLYYALTSRFELWVPGYILVNLALWVGTLLLLARVLWPWLGARATMVVLTLGLVPTFATTVIFSPAMQSIGTLSLFYWALSLAVLDAAVRRHSWPLALVSLLPVLLLLGTYESAMPLLGLSALWPLAMGTGSFWQNLRRPTLWLYGLGLAALLVLMFFYQKVWAPAWFGDYANISRLRQTGGESFALLNEANVLRIEEMIKVTGPALLREALHRLWDAGVGFASWLAATILVAALWLWPGRAPAPLLSWWRLALLGMGIYAGVHGVVLLHTGAAMAPTMVGYINRGMAATGVLLPLTLALVVAGAGRLSPRLQLAALVPALVVASGLLAGFIVQRDQYLASAALQEKILVDVTRQLAPHLPAEATPRIITPPLVVLADVPEFLADTFNDETVFSDEVTDWHLALRLRTEGRAGGATLTAKKVCSERERVVLDGQMLKIDYNFAQPLGSGWFFYRYDAAAGTGQLRPIDNLRTLRQLLRQEFGCPWPVRATKP